MLSIGLFHTTRWLGPDPSEARMVPLPWGARPSVLGSLYGMCGPSWRGRRRAPGGHGCYGHWGPALRGSQCHPTPTALLHEARPQVPSGGVRSDIISLAGPSREGAEDAFKEKSSKSGHRAQPDTFLKNDTWQRKGLAFVGG